MVGGFAELLVAWLLELAVTEVTFPVGGFLRHRILCMQRSVQARAVHRRLEQRQQEQQRPGRVPGPLFRGRTRGLRVPPQLSRLLQAGLNGRLI